MIYTPQQIANQTLLRKLNKMQKTVVMRMIRCSKTVNHPMKRLERTLCDKGIHVYDHESNELAGSIMSMSLG